MLNCIDLNLMFYPNAKNCPQMHSDAGRNPRTSMSAMDRFYLWWRQLDTSPVPSVTRIDPTQIGADILPGISMMDIVGQGRQRRMRIRLAGSRHREMTGRELTGVWLDEWRPPAVVEMTMARLCRIFDTGEPDYRSLSVEEANAFLPPDPAMTYHRLICPIDIGSHRERRLIAYFEWFNPDWDRVPPPPRVGPWAEPAD